MITVFLLFLTCLQLIHAQEITPYKFKEYPYEVAYEIPASSRFVIRRVLEEPDIVYYFTKPHSVKQYPIAILVGGSTSADHIGSIIPFHRYFLQELLDLGVAVMTIEQWGVDGNTVDEQTFMEHYTRGQRLQDHLKVMAYLLENRPIGWDGTFILLGVSEGGPLVTSLAEMCPYVRATINWCGAGDWRWDDELWEYLCILRKNGPWWIKMMYWLPLWSSYSLPTTRDSFDAIMKACLEDPCVDKTFAGMTYRYHSDALCYPLHKYSDIKTPFLVVCGTEDPLIKSSDAFVEKATKAGALITYIRVDGMDHYVRKRPDIIEQSFAWLRDILKRDAH